MPSEIRLTVNGVSLGVEPGTTVAVALVMAGVASRKSVTGEARGPLCGMGICFECRATINGRAHSRSCQIECEPGMRVKTDE